MKPQTIASIFVLALTGLSSGASAPAVVPDKPQVYIMSKREYESAAVIQLFVRPMNNAAQQEFFAQQMEKIIARDNLREAIQELIPGSEKGKDAILNQVKQGLKIEYVRATNLLKISVRAGNKQFSCDLANKLAERYLKNHKLLKGEEEPRIHQKAEIGVLIEKKKQ